jgi:hypothetical protein
VSLPISDIHQVIDGVTLPEHASLPSPHHYTTLKTRLGLVVLACDSFSVTANLQLLCGQPQVSSDGALRDYLASADTLALQLRISRRLLSRYRNNLEVRPMKDSVCDLASGAPSVKGVYELVLLNLRGLCEVKSSPEDWLRAERLNLRGATDALGSIKEFS